MRLCSWFAGIDLDSRSITAALGCSTDGGPPRLLGCQRVALSSTDRIAAATQQTVLDAISRFAEWFHLESGGALPSVSLAVPEPVLQEVPASSEHHFTAPVLVDSAVMAEMRERALQRVRSLGPLVKCVDRAVELDGRRYAGPPLGQYATEMRVELAAWVARSSVVEPVSDMLERSGFEIGLVTPRSEATAESILTPSERRDGAIVVTINDTDSSVAVLVNSAVVDLFTVPLGREPLLAELARACNVSVDVVERLDLGLMLDRVPSDPMVQRVRTVMSGWGSALFTGVRRRIDNSNLSWRVQAGIVIAGSPHAFPALDDCAARVLGVPARFATMSPLAAESRIGNAGTFAAVGLLPLEWRTVTEESLDEMPDSVEVVIGERTPRIDVTERHGIGQALGRWLREFVPADH